MVAGLSKDDTDKGVHYKNKEKRNKMDISAILEKLTLGSMMYYGGFIGVGIGVFLILICLIAFPIQRRKVLRRLGEE